MRKSTWIGPWVVAGGLPLLLLFTLLTFSLIFTGCRSQEAVQTGTETYERQMAGAPAPASEPLMDNVASGLEQKAKRADFREKSARPGSPPPPGGGPQTAPGPVLKPQLIIEAQVSMKVDRLPESVRQVEGLVTGLGGYITAKNLSLSDEQGHYRSAYMTIRLPQPNVDRFMRAAGGIGKIMDERVSATDVSKQIVDTEARIRNLQAEEKQLLAIMNRAGKIPEVLEVARELARVRGDIEMAQGSVNYLKSQVAFSTINLSMSEKVITPAASTRPGIGTALANAVSKAGDDLYSFALWLSSGLIWLTLSFLPRLLILGLVALLLLKLIRRFVPRPAWLSFRRKPAPEPAPMQPEEGG